MTILMKNGNSYQAENIKFQLNEQALSFEDLYDDIDSQKQVQLEAIERITGE
jgi:hypothetical protein